MTVVLQAREAVEMRAQLEKKMAQKEKEKREESLRALAQKAREERAGIRRVEGKCQYDTAGVRLFLSKDSLPNCFFQYIDRHFVEM